MNHIMKNKQKYTWMYTFVSLVKTCCMLFMSAIFDIIFDIIRNIILDNVLLTIFINNMIITIIVVFSLLGFLFFIAHRPLYSANIESIPHFV